ncbi:hypothetical protein PSN45_004909 [Yamadazyma tenuis]|uniref:E set domain-containing protein n=1 Tax=Candida tenuis (strain ATCC 10573 / BCRC 21748 / CBS 615 / JCM 9827 / NBRC 10315 / NRRL Y-1498 / VKM Y-70) TaxID=590646 RepID=G3B230_CANTC|nr:uncharacterized protein CANTEDRAFT_113366 [Yamadazyma tenuis ATCC 10573]EGV64594.1 hypothetical protein CANTEDRAFT_113366 [Yamadazyma tenuis ATCC 10573]WEJ97358.1 hypothetical protein PSN45_004909 [Yamadazyma tenuis]
MGIPESGEYEILKFVLKIEGREELLTVPVAGAENIEMSIPEGTNYVVTIYFKINKPVKNFKYIQIGRKAGIVVKRTERILGESFEPREEPYSVEFDQETTPAGFLFRGKTPMTSTYYIDDKEIQTVDWTVEITKK